MTEKYIGEGWLSVVSQENVDTVEVDIQFPSGTFCGDSNAVYKPHNDRSYVRCQKCHATGPLNAFIASRALSGKRVSQHQPWGDNQDPIELTEDSKSAYISPQSLPRDQAIKRIKDIQGGNGGDVRAGFPDSMKGNLAKRCWNDDMFAYGMEYGAIAELMAIFDIKEDELK